MAEQSSPVDSDRAPGSEITASESADGAPQLDERSAFLDAMARAMQKTVTEARTRVAEDVERQRLVHIAAINARREVEASRICELADSDQKAIDTWAAGERVRIQLERARRRDELQLDLESSLAELRSKIDREIESAEAAIAAHRTDLDAFFASLRHQTDPVAIAQHAIRRPPFPTFETMAGDGDTERPDGHAVSPDVSRTEVPAADAVHGAPEQPAAATTMPAEPAVRVDAPAVRDDAPAVAVMDELAAKRAKWWAMWTALPDPPEVLHPVDQGDQDGQPLEAVRVGSDSKESGSGSASS
jgi:hypothetical protein